MQFLLHLERGHAWSLAIAHNAILAPYPAAVGRAKDPPVERMFPVGRTRWGAGCLGRRRPEA
jgi:hypothetical protein